MFFMSSLLICSGWRKSFSIILIHKIFHIFAKYSSVHSTFRNQSVCEPRGSSFGHSVAKEVFMSVIFHRALFEILGVLDLKRKLVEK